MKRREVIIPVPYPTDKRGEPVSPLELGYCAEWESPELKRTNHHLAFFRRSFGATAIGSAYRNLESLQQPLIASEHVFLHRTYTGLKVPKPNVMLDRIAAEYENAGFFKEQERAVGGYALRMITAEDIEHLEGMYGK